MSHMHAFVVCLYGPSDMFNISHGSVTQVVHFMMSCNLLVEGVLTSYRVIAILKTNGHNM